MKTALIKFFEWLHFEKQIYDEYENYYQDKIVKIKGINCFLVDRYYGLSKASFGRYTVSPIWDKQRFLCLLKRLRKGINLQKQKIMM